MLLTRGELTKRLGKVSIQHAMEILAHDQAQRNLVEGKVALALPLRRSSRVCPGNLRKR